MKVLYESYLVVAGVSSSQLSGRDHVGAGVLVGVRLGADRTAVEGVAAVEDNHQGRSSCEQNTDDRENDGGH